MQTVLTSVLNHLLGQFVEHLDSSNLKLGVFKGDVSLNNLKLKVDALNFLKLPIKIKEGFLGEFRLKIPWKNLKNGTILLEINKIYLICSSSNYVNDDDAIEQAYEIKKKLLESYELSQKEKKIKSPGFVDSLVAKIIDNLKVSIKNIHLRYEGAAFRRNFAFGITLDQLNIQSSDKDWNGNTNTRTDTLFKNITFDHLSLYWDTDTDPVVFNSIEEFDRKLDSLIPKKNKEQVYHQYLLRPVGGILKLKMKKFAYALGDSLEEPRFDILAHFETFSFTFEDLQYKMIVHIASLLGRFYRMEKFNIYHKPKAPVRIGMDQVSKEWWKYIYRCGKGIVLEKKGLFNWDTLVTTTQKRKEYVSLWKKKNFKIEKIQEKSRKFQN
ncbi:vacuolar protein sorting-associated protein 13a-related [Anaeramoeba ignava]|uniref:Vacuolar protein sorting-associated protein 13a-related n=1 Tax=Anaeramoeba ignava TaxID=1746090 RepID=A0A9Q0LNK2_ANAIG|nr:vacuolar protein sorting-associated protein 13a-related [Anaeramoeba ignava]